MVVDKRGWWNWSRFIGLIRRGIGPEIIFDFVKRYESDLDGEKIETWKGKEPNNKI